MQTEKNHAGEFLLSEASGTRSREVLTIVSGHDIKAGTLLGKVTASGKFAPYSNAASDGTQTAIGIIYTDIDTSATGLNADGEAVAIVRDAEVSLDMLYGHDAAGETELNALGIIVRA